MTKVYTKEPAFAAELDNRSCIWWGTLCAWDWFRARNAADVKLALDICVRWYHDPSEENRIAAGKQLDNEQLDKTVTMLLRAIFFTGNVAPKDCPAVMLDANTSRLMVASCLDMLLAKAPAVQRDDYANRFEQIRREMAQAA